MKNLLSFIFAQLVFFIVFILFVAFSSPTNADIYETASLGSARYLLSAPDNPAWCQNGFECREGKSATVWSLGVGKQFSRHLAGELTYHDLGKYTQLGAWACNDDGAVCGPTTYDYSESATRGLALSTVVGMENGVYVRAGVLRWRSAWHTYMSNAGDKHATRFNDYRAQKPDGWSPEIGLGVRWHQYHAELTRFTIIKPHDGSIQGINTMTLGRSF